MRSLVDIQGRIRTGFYLYILVFSYPFMERLVVHKFLSGSNPSLTQLSSQQPCERLWLAEGHPGNFMAAGT